MCDRYGFSVRRVVDFIVGLEDLSASRKGTLIATVLGGELFLSEMSENKRSEYRHLVEQLGLPGPVPRRAGRPSLNELGEEARQLRERVREREAIWRDDVAS